MRGDRRLPSGKWDWWLEGDSRIAYLRITYFGNRTSLEITELIEQLLIEHSPEGLVIDLRGNSGGSLEAGVELCDLFLEEGLIAVLTNDRKTSRSNRKQLQKVVGNVWSGAERCTNRCFG